MAKAKLDWKPVDTDNLPAAVAKAFGKYNQAMDAMKASAAYKAMTAARDAFEATFETVAKEKGKLTAGEQLRFGYRFGKVTVAVDTKAESTKRGSFDL